MGQGQEAGLLVEDVEANEADINNYVTGLLANTKDEIQSEEFVDVLITPTDKLVDIMVGFINKGIDNLTKDEEKTRHLISQELKTRAVDDTW